MDRVRGYQSSQSGPRPPKLNRAPFRKLAADGESPTRGSARREKATTLDEGVEKVAESAETRPLTPSAGAKDLEDLGFAKLFTES